MSVVGFIRKALDAGLDLDTALKMGEAFEAEAQPMAPALTARQARNQRYYAAKRLKASESKTTKTDSDVSDASKTVKTPPASRPRVGDITPNSETPDPAVVVAVVDAGAGPDDWPAGKVDQHAKLLIEAVGSPWLDPTKSLDLLTTRGRIAAWRRDGASWEHDVLPVVTKLCTNRRSRIGSWKFFDAAIAQSIADNRAALQIPEARSTGPPGMFDPANNAHRPSDRPHERPDPQSAKFTARQANHARALAGADSAARQRWEP